VKQITLKMLKGNKSNPVLL